MSRDVLKQEDMKRIKIAFFGCSLLFFTTATAQTAEKATYSKAGLMSAQVKNRPVEMYHAKGDQVQNVQIKAVLADADRLKKIEAVDRSIKSRRK